MALGMGSWWKGLPATIARFVLVWPWAIYDSFARRHWKLIRDHPELHAGIYSPSIAKWENSVALWARIGFFYNFAVAMPAILMSAPFSMMFGFFDIVIAIVVAVNTGFQSGYVPHSLKACYKGGSHTFQLPPGANESFFEAIARLNTTALEGRNFCKNFVQERNLGIAFSVMYTVLALCNMYFCIVLFKQARKKLQSQGKPFRPWFVEHALEVPKYLYYFLSGLFYLIPVVLFRCLPGGVKWPTRYARRYTTKAAQRISSPHEVKIKMTSRHHKKPGKARSSSDKLIAQNPLGSFLSIYDICILVVEELHYNDIMALSLASKSVHEALFPSMGLSPAQISSQRSQRLSHYRLYSCDPLTRSTCYLCSSQVCELCHRIQYVRQTCFSWHLDCCVPYCKKCYITAHKTALSVNRISPPRCSCAPPHENRRFLDLFTWWKSSSGVANWSWQYATRSICRDCDKLNTSQIEERTVERSRVELKNPRRQGMQRCGGGRMERNAVNGTACGELLVNGPSWWICAVCKKECSASCHLAWTNVNKNEV